MINYRLLTEFLVNFLQREMKIRLFSIWHTPHARGELDLLIESYIKIWFPLIHAFLMIYTIVGMGYQIIQFMQVAFFLERPLFMWRARVFYGLKDRALRKFRLIGSLIMITYWSMLLYGLVKISTVWLTPWLYISFAIMILDYVMWCLELIFRHQKFSWNSLLSFILPFFIQFLVWRVKIFIDNANARKNSWFF